MRGRALPCALALLARGCSCRDGSECDVVVYASVDRVFSDPVFRAFEAEAGQDVCALFDTEETKSTGVLNRLLAESDHPRADMFWSGDPFRCFVLVSQEMVTPHISPATRVRPEAFNPTDGTWAGLAARPRVLLVDTRRLDERPAPQSILDRADPRFRGDAAIANPLSGTTTVHVAALAALWGEDRARTPQGDAEALHRSAPRAEGDRDLRHTRRPGARWPGRPGSLTRERAHRTGGFARPLRQCPETPFVEAVLQEEEGP